MFDFLDNLKMSLDNYLYENVVRGAAWLDDEKRGWENNIDISALQMHSGYNCICGQLFMGHFKYVSDKYGSVFCTEHGFEIPLTKLEEIILPRNLNPYIYEQLAYEWVLQIEKRLANA